MKLIDESADIDFSFIKQNQVTPNYRYKDEFSPVFFLDYLEKTIDTGVSPEEYYGSWFDIAGYWESIKNKLND